MLALTIVAGGVFAASAGSNPLDTQGFTYKLNAAFTNNPPVIVDISGIPDVTAANVPILNPGLGVTMTDGAGKIDGVWGVQITNLTGTAPFTYADMVVDVSGSITASKGVAQAKMTLKGNGRAYDSGFLATTNGAATVNMTFASTKGQGVTFRSDSEGPFSTNVYVFLNDSTNYNSIDQSHDPVITYRSRPALSSLMFELNTSSAVTNGANQRVDVQNDVYPVTGGAMTNGQGFVFYFGSGTLVSNLYVLLGTNLFQLAKLGDDINYQTVGTNVTHADTNAIYGIAIETVPSFIAGYTAAFTTNGVNTNLGTTSVSKVVGVATNTSAATLVNETDPGTLTYSNGWYEVSGVVNGSIKAGKATYKFPKDTASIFTTPHFLVSSFMYPLSTSTNETYTTNGAVITTNVVVTTNFVQAVRKTTVTGSSISLNPMDSLSGVAVRFGKKLYTSSVLDPIDGSGKGSVSASSKATNYNLSIKGVSRSKGGSLKLTGTTDPKYIAGYAVFTNVITVTNVASLGLVTDTFTNTTAHTIYPTDRYHTTNAVLQVGTTNVLYTVFSDNRFINITTPPLIVTNIDAYGIRTIKANGKIKGQTLPKDVPGMNADNPFPEHEVD